MSDAAIAAALRATSVRCGDLLIKSNLRLQACAQRETPKISAGKHTGVSGG